MPVDSGSSLWTQIRTRSPWSTSMVGPGHRVVEAPDVDVQVGQELAPGVAAIEVEFLDAVDHLPGELLGQVGNDHARRRFAGGPEPRHEHAAVGRAANRSPGAGPVARIIAGGCVPVVFVARWMRRRRFLRLGRRTEGYERAPLEKCASGRLASHARRPLRVDLSPDGHGGNPPAVAMPVNSNKYTAKGTSERSVDGIPGSSMINLVS